MVGTFVGLMASGAFATVSAQTQTLQRGQTAGPRFMVPTFKSQERGVGLQAAEAIRERMGQDFQLKTLWIVPKSDIMTTLVNSGYSTTEALSSNDARALAQLLRAEEYVEGNVEKTGTGYRVTANLMLVRPDGMVQPLPPVDVAKVSDAAKGISNAVEAARKQIDPTKKCIDLYRAKKYPEAIAEAKKGIAAYPNAVMPRVCIAEAYNDQKLGADSMIAISEQILKIHKDNKRALAFAADPTPRRRWRTSRSRRSRVSSRSIPTTRGCRPRSSTFSPQVARRRSRCRLSTTPSRTTPATRRCASPMARPLRGEGHQGRARHRRRDGEARHGVGRHTFFIRQAAAYAADSQFKKASETLARGRQKFPNNMSISATYVQLLIQTGQTAQAIEVAKGILKDNPKIRGIWLPIAKAQSDAGAPPDTVMASLRSAIAAGDSAGLVATYATGLGQAEQKKAAAANPKDIDGLRRALTYLQFSDSVQKSAAAAFLQGATHLQKGQALLEQARDKKSCDMAKEATQDFTDAQIFISRGAAEFRDQAGQLMSALQQLSPYGDQMVKALCKGK